jgi:hypothetical protein
MYVLFQSKINSELASNGVHIYQFPIDDESVAEVNTSMNAHVPFAVVGSTDFVRVGNKMMRSRQYPWGTVQGTVIFNFWSSHIFIQENIAMYVILHKIPKVLLKCDNHPLQCVVLEQQLRIIIIILHRHIQT